MFHVKTNVVATALIAGMTSVFGIAESSQDESQRNQQPTTERPETTDTNDNLDTIGDSLPTDAVLRLGTTRFRQEGEITQLMYSSDGKKMASVSRDAVIIWEAETGRQLRRLRPQSDDAYSQRISTVCFSPDGEEVASAGNSGVHIWEVNTGLELLSFPVASGLDPFGGIEQLRYSPDGGRLAVGGGGTSVNIFDTSTGDKTISLTIENHRAAFYGICWTPDGTHLSAGTLDPAVVSWDVESGEVVRRFEVEKDHAFTSASAYANDGSMLIAATSGVVHFWDSATGRHIRSIEVDAKHINTLVLTPNNKALIIGSQDGVIRVVDVETGKLRRKIDGGLWIGRTIAVSPDFKTVALGAVFPTIRQWDIDTGEERFPELTSFGHDAEVHCVAFSPDGELIASGGSNKQINLWEASTGKFRLKIQSPSSANRIAFDPNGELLLTSWRSTGMVRVWDVVTGQEVKTIDSGMGKLRAFALTPNGKHLISVGSNSKYGWHSPIGEETFHVWDFERGNKLREFTFKTASTESVAVTPDGRALVTGSANGVSHVMDLESGKVLATLPGHQHSVNSLAFSANGRLLASGSTDQTIRIWDVATWKSLRVFKGHQRAVTSVVFLLNDRMLASGSGKRSYPLSAKHSQRIRIWDVDSGEQMGFFAGHETNVSALAFSPKGRRLASGHADTTVLIWDVSQIIK